MDAIGYFLSQAVVDIVQDFRDPLQASKKIVETSTDSWLEEENRTDDITFICIFFKENHLDGYEPTISSTEKPPDSLVEGQNHPRTTRTGTDNFDASESTI